MMYRTGSIRKTVLFIVSIFVILVLLSGSVSAAEGLVVYPHDEKIPVDAHIVSSNMISSPRTAYFDSILYASNDSLYLNQSDSWCTINEPGTYTFQPVYKYYTSEEHTIISPEYADSVIARTPGYGYDIDFTSNVSTTEISNPMTIQFDGMKEKYDGYTKNGQTYDFTVVWNFGDGSTSTDWNPVHTYDEAGVYTVSMSLYSYNVNNPDQNWKEGTETKKDYISSTRVREVGPLNSGCEYEGADGLIQATKDLQEYDTIMIRDGTYFIPEKMYINTNHVTIRSTSRNPNSVIIRGDMCSDNDLIVVDQAYCTIEYITLENAPKNAIFLTTEENHYLDADYSKIRYNKIKNSGENGIYYYIATNRYLTETFIEYNQITGCGVSGVKIDGDLDTLYQDGYNDPNIIRGNYLDNNGDYEIIYRGGSITATSENGIYVYDNHISNNVIIKYPRSYDFYPRKLLQNIPTSYVYEGNSVDLPCPVNYINDSSNIHLKYTNNGNFDTVPLGEYPLVDVDNNGVYDNVDVDISGDTYDAHPAAGITEINSDDVTLIEKISTRWPVDDRHYYCTANYTISDYSVTSVNEEIEFVDLSHEGKPNSGFESDDSILYYEWDFGDGHISYEKNPTHVYDSVGSHYPTLTIENKYGVTSTYTPSEPVQISTSVPNAVVKANTTSGTGTTSIQFDARDSSGIFATKWDFGDGTIVYGDHENPKLLVDHTFKPSKSPIEVEFTVFTGDFSKDVETIELDISPEPAPDLDVNMNSYVDENDSIFATLDATGSSNLAKYDWNFGDGTSLEVEKDNQLNVFMNEIPVTFEMFDTNLRQYHQYSPGAYIIKLVGYGYENSIVNKYLYLSYENLIPSASMQYSPTDPVIDWTKFENGTTVGTQKANITFDGTQSENYDMYEWNFGDGTTSSTCGMQPTHEYGIGNYNVSLTVRNNHGQLDTVTQSIDVKYPEPEVSFNSNITESYDSATISFDATKFLNVDHYEWSFGDGTNSTVCGTDPVHVYNDTGYYVVTLSAWNQDGEIDTFSSMIKIRSSTNVDFTSDKQSGSVPLEVQFMDKSVNIPGGIDSCVWAYMPADDFDTSDIVLEDYDDLSPIHTFTEPGEYTVYHKVTSVDHNETFETHKYRYIEVTDMFDTDFVYDVNTTYPNKVTFNASTSEYCDSYYWTFGDNTSATGPNVTHTFNIPNNEISHDYEVTLHTEDHLSNANHVSKIVRVYVSPSADFSWNYIDGEDFSPVNISFTSQSKYTNHCEWDFGDGSTSNEVNPVHQYDSGGNYNVSLTVWNDILSDTITYNNIIHVSDIDFIADQTNSPSPATITFMDSSNNLVHDSSVSWYNWSFGDGQYINKTSMQSVTHDYSNPGTYDISMTYHDGNTGRDETITKSNYIQIYGDRPIADFDINVIDPMNPASFEIIDQSTNDPDDYLWYLNDDSEPISYESNPVININDTGTHSLTLRVANEHGYDEITKENIITVYGNAEANYSYHLDPDNNRNVVFYAGNSKNVEEYSWDFGDGKTVTVSNDHVSHYYDMDDDIDKLDFDVTLTVSNSGGSISSTTKNVTVYQPPYASIIPIGDNFTKNEEIQFDCITKHVVDTYWQFGDNNSSCEMTPSHTYTNNGSYTVELIVHNENGQEYYTSKEIEIGTDPIIDFSANRTSGYIPTYVSFDEDCINVPPNTEYEWNFGNGNTSTLRNPPVQKYNESGSYDISLKITNPETGDSFTGVKRDYIAIDDVPLVDFSIGDTTGNVPMKVQFDVDINNMPNDNASDIVYNWNFGDNTTSMLSEPVHTYQSIGKYDVSLSVYSRVYDEYYNITKPDFVEVNEPNIAHFNANKTSINVSESIEFEAVTIIEDGQYSWNLGDGTSMTGTNVIHSYDESGNYNVTLNVANLNHSDEYTREYYIHVYSIPDAKFNITPTVGYQDTIFQISDESTNTSYYEWNYGDGNVYTGSKYPPTHVYDNEQTDKLSTYTIGLKAFNPSGYVDNYYKNITIYNDPIFNYNTVSNEVFENSQTEFNIDILNMDNMSYTWNFGDGISETTYNDTTTISHVYPNSGIYRTNVTVENEYGVSKTSPDILINVKPRDDSVDFTVSRNIITVNDTITFDGQNINTTNPEIEYVWNLGDNTSIQNLESFDHTYIAPGIYDVSLEVSQFSPVNHSYDNYTITKPSFIEVVNEPQPNFDITPIIGSPIGSKAPTVFQFSDTSSGITQYIWDFGIRNGKYTVDENPPGKTFEIPSYVSSDEREISLTGINDAGKSSTIRKTITLYNDPVADFSVDSDPSAINENVKFYADKSHIIESYTWDFGDGTTSSNATTSHVYTVPGTYNVSLTVQNPCGVTDTLHKEITIGNIVISDINSNKTDITYGESIELNSTILGYVSNYTWNITGDNGINITSSEECPVISGLDIGNYSISLSASDGSVVNTSTKDDYIHVYGIPDASFSIDNVSGTGRVSVDITDTSNEYVSEYEWSLGTNHGTYYGSTPDTQMYYQIDENVTSYDIILNGYNKAGYVDQHMETITVYHSPEPVMNLSTTGVGTNDNVTIDLTGSKYCYMDNGNPSFEIDFGDGSSTTLDEIQSVNHSYTSEGTYNITVSGHNNYGSIDRFQNVSQKINVYNGPHVDFTSNKTIVTVDQPVKFSDLSVNTNTPYHWTFGDGTSSSTIEPIHTYSTPGNYTVTLSTDGNSTSQSYIDYINVVPESEPNFEYMLSDTYSGRAMLHLTDTSSNASEYEWDFGDGTITTSQNPDDHRYYVDGESETFNVTLTTWNIAGYSTNKTIPITIWHDVDVSMEVSPTEGLSPLSVSIDASESLYVDEYKWDFGDDTGFEFGEQVTHTYTEPGVYHIKLEASNNHNTRSHTDTSTRIEVYEDIEANFTTNVETGTNITTPATVQFQDTSTGDNLDYHEWDFNGDGIVDISGYNVDDPEYTYTVPGTYNVIHKVSNDYTQDSIEKTNCIIVDNKPITDFDINTVVGTETITQFNITDKSSNVMSYEWDFGDGTIISDTNNPDPHVYGIDADPETMNDEYHTYNITLSGQNENGIQSECTKQVTVYHIPRASFTVSDNVVDSDTYVQFDASNSEHYSSIYWNFGDRTQSNQLNPEHKYGSNGIDQANYTVSLKAYNKLGHYDETTQKISVYSLPEFDLECNTTGGFDPLDVKCELHGNFVDDYTIDFGDGTSISGNDFDGTVYNHTYSLRPGETSSLYEINLNVSNECGTGEITKNIVVNEEPDLSITAVPNDGSSPLISILNVVSYSVPECIVDFGDGQSTTIQFNDTKHSESIAHVYEANNLPTRNIIVSAIGENEQGINETDSDTITVHGLPYDLSIDQTITESTVPSDVTFEIHGNNVETCTWDFGDGTSKEGLRVTHTYDTISEDEKVFDITATAGNGYGGTAKTFTTFHAFSEPDVEIQCNETSGTGDTTIKLEAVGEHFNPGSCVWYFGDGTSVEGTDTVVHEFKSNDEYTQEYEVDLICSNGISDGRSETHVSQTITIYVEPEAIITASKVVDTVPTTIEFDAYKSKYATEYQWDFGDGATASDTPIVSHTYDEKGQYLVNLTVHNERGESNSDYLTIYVYDNPQPAFDISPSEGISPVVVDITDKSKGVSHYIWDFGDGTTLNGVSPPDHVYSLDTDKVKNYTITLTGSNQMGISSEISKQVMVKHPIDDLLYVSNMSSGMEPLTVGFSASSNYADNYTWDFADGGTSTGTSVAHTFDSNGQSSITYPVKLTALNDYGVSTGETINITVYGSPSIDSMQCIALDNISQYDENITYPMITEGTSGQNVICAINGQNLHDIQWSFGDGIFGYGDLVSHEYTLDKDTESKTFTIEVEATNINGDNVIDSHSFTLFNDPVASIGSNKKYVPINEDVTFETLKSKFVHEYNIDFDDGTDISGTNIQPEYVHSYSSPGTYNVTLDITNAIGVNESDTLEIIVYDTSSIDFNGIVTSEGGNAETDIPNIPDGIYPLEVQFTGTSMNNANNWTWNFGDGNTETGQNVTHTYTQPGYYDVTLNATNTTSIFNTTTNTTEWINSSLELTKNEFVKVYPKLPVADYKILDNRTNHTGYGPYTVGFTALNPGGYNVTGWYWEFDDQLPQTDENPTHTFYEVGRHNVTLTVYNEAGSDTITKPSESVYVMNPIEISASSTDVQRHENITFYANSTQQHATWIWDFGDGLGDFQASENVTKTDTSIEHMYTQAGNYTVTVNVVNRTRANENYTKSYSTPIHVSNTFLPKVECGENIIHGISAQVVFNDLTPSGLINITDRVWDFGDGTVIHTNQTTVTHNYTGYGNYDVTLTIHGSDGSSASRTYDNYIQLTNAPFADFSATNTTGYIPYPVSLNATSTLDNANYEWSFGDGYAYTGQNITKTIYENRAYDVSLHVYNDTYSGYVNKPGYIHGSTEEITYPTAAFNVSTTAGQSPLAVTFMDESSGSPNSWHWTFGDGEESYDQNVTHTFDHYGTYTITLTVANENGTDSIIKNNLITVSEIPEPDFTASPTTGDSPLEVFFWDQTSGDADYWTWNFGDGTTLTSNNIADAYHRYDEDGQYTISLTVGNEAGSNTVTKEQYIQVGDASDASFDILDTSGTLSEDGIEGKVPLVVNFRDTSINNPTRWKWNFGDGVYSTNQNPTHEYTVPGTYTVTLEIENTNGISSVIKPMYINAKVDENTTKPYGSFDVSNENQYIDRNVTFVAAMSPNTDEWVWDFGDGEYSPIFLQNETNSTYTVEGSDMVYHNITHIYSNEGTYTPRLTMTNENGVTEYYKHQLIDIKLPVDFEYNVQYPYDNPLTAEFEADVFLDSPYSVRWNFGDFTYDPNTDNETSVTHTYGEEGIYSVTMTIEKNGVQYTKTKDNIISVYPKTMIELPSEIEPGTICAIEQIYESEDYNDNGIIRNVQVPDHYYVSTYDSYWIDGDNVRRISSFEAPLDMGDLDLGTTLTEIPSTWKYVETNENPIGQIVDKRINSTSTTIIIDGQTTTYTDTKYLFDMYIDNVNTDNQYECTYIVPAYIYNSYENGDNIEVRSSEWTLF